MIEQLEPYLPILALAFSAISGLVGIKFGMVKNKISNIRALIDSVDEALKDDKITEKEFREIFKNFKTLVKG
jgi:hypothetical protein